MGQIRLQLREPSSIPIEADCITPDRLLGLSWEEICRLPLYCGRRQVALAELFQVQGERADTVVVEGDLGQVKRLGQGMTGGRLVIRGQVGMHVGACMRAGEIVIEGDAGDWLGAHMQGGIIRVRGSAGHLVGAAYRGEKRGMNRGTIIVEGNAGHEVGALMRRGCLAIGGDVGDFAGARMIAGTLFVFGRLGARAAAGIKRGTVVALGGDEDLELLPTFRYACTYRPAFLRFYLLELRRLGLPVTDAHLAGCYRRYTGDITSVGKGEILVYDQR